MQFNEYLKLCREETQLTQEQLVHDLYSFDIENFESLDTSMLSKWERGVTQPKVAKQVSLIKYFQKHTDTALPYLDKFSVEEAENLLCRSAVHNIIGTNKKLTLDFPSQMMDIDNLKVYPLRHFERMDTLLAVNLDIHQEMTNPYAQISLEQFKEWGLHPSNLFLACEYKDAFLGLFFSVRLKPNIFEKILNFEMRKSDITIDDFASFEEDGCIFMLSFYGLNKKVSTMLMARFYAHLIANQKNISAVGGLTSQDSIRKTVNLMNLEVRGTKTLENHTELDAYSQTLDKVLASANVVKMILSKQGCPEE